MLKNEFVRKHHVITFLLGGRINSITATGFSAFEIPTFNRFVEAALSGNMPGNNKTELPLFPPTDMAFFSQPYKDWAPEPYSQLPGPQAPFGASIKVSPPAVIRIMHVMSGLDDIFDMALSNTQPSSMERSFKVMKTKVGYRFRRSGCHVDALGLVWRCSRVGCPLASKGFGC
jgi:hypothetical protein